MSSNSIGSRWYDTKYAVNCVFAVSRTLPFNRVVVLIEHAAKKLKLVNFPAKSCVTSSQWIKSMYSIHRTVITGVYTKLLACLLSSFWCYFILFESSSQPVKLLGTFRFILFFSIFVSLWFFVVAAPALSLSCLLCLFLLSVVFKWIIYAHIVSVCVLYFDRHHRIEFWWDFCNIAWCLLMLSVSWSLATIAKKIFKSKKSLVNCLLWARARAWLLDVRECRVKMWYCAIFSIYLDNIGLNTTVTEPSI